MSTIRASIDRHVERLRRARGAHGGDEVRGRLNDAGMRAAGRVAAVLHAMLGGRSHGRLGILTYHRVSPAISGLPFPLHNVTPEAFRAQLDGLLRRGFRVWPLERALAAAAMREPIPPGTLVITFDDGFESVYANAWPALRERGLPATIFLATADLDGGQPFWFDAWGRAFEGRVPPETYLPLSTAQCCEMAASGLISLGAHTHTHEDFRGRPNDFERDLARSASIVRDRFEVKEVPFAFPFGSRHLGFADPALCEAARRAGVVCGLTTEATNVDAATDPFTWGRFNVFSWDTDATLAAKLEGWYAWAPRLRQRLGSAFRRAPNADEARPSRSARPSTRRAGPAKGDLSERSGIQCGPDGRWAVGQVSLAASRETGRAIGNSIERS